MYSSVFQFSRPEEDRRNATELYNPYTKEELKAKWSFFNWDTYFEGVFADTDVFINGDEKIIVREPGYLDGLGQVLSTLTPQAQGLKYKSTILTCILNVSYS